MGRSPCCEADANMKKGPWAAEEDKLLMDDIKQHGPGNWRHLPKRAGLNRCSKSCRLRWTNYLRPDIKRGPFSEGEERLIIHLHSILGNKWSAIANQLPAGRTDNEIKNYWNSHIRKKLLMMGIDPVTHRPRTDLNLLANLPTLVAAAANFNNLATNPLMNALDQLPKLQLLQTLIQSITSGSSNILGTPFGFQNPNQTPLGFPSSSIQHFPNVNLSMDGNYYVQQMNYGSCNSSEVGSGTTIATATSLASGSPENYTVDQAPDLVNSGDALSAPPSSTPFEPWNVLNFDDLDADLGWKDILNQISWSNPLEEELEVLKK